MMELHILKKVRDFLKLDESLFSIEGNVIFVDLHSARKFVHIYNEKTRKRINAGHTFVAGTICEILHYVIFLYREKVRWDVFEELLLHLYEKIGVEKVDEALESFLEEFPPTPLYTGNVSKDAYLLERGKKSKILEETLMLWLENMNPAFSFLKEIINDETLRRETIYLRLIKEMKDFFNTQRPFGPHNQNLIEMLQSPAVVEPNSLEGQLRYILENWGYLLTNLNLKIKKGIDLVKEEKVFFFLGTKAHEVYTYEEAGEDLRISEDKEWMKNLVLVAKHTYIWLEQLSTKYGRRIERIDQIPEEELELLKKWGINGIWLIGLWERSSASKKIKNLCGNPDAIASAYSIYDYRIAEDLGGEEAYEKLREKAQNFGIRIGCDMVPNHMGIYSKWMIERPKWFIYRMDNPYPWYSFTSYNLSPHENVEIYIEDHYYDRTDAAVVCKRVDKRTGETMYIYHGNDGTGMPWNDTVQLNYLLPEVREEMINTIISVAKRFPIIRFDAAMTLTKMHFQRLWFPEPGKGGAIPTRAEFSMSREEFDRKMPKEFWREVVDRVKAEAPDTILIAEAFWLLEGYFIRNLGMHRVYNSAFMHMMRDEENEKYRRIIKNTLEADPEILKRFVNFMSNPDERTAYDQFGDGEKYFGVLTLMVTMPGLPMFGHGQIEGLKEKYGMEFKRPYLNEEPDQGFIRRHEKEIFPLLNKRYLFSEVDNFRLYDFMKEDGSFDEDVFAFSNQYGEERALVVYHNRSKETEGWLKLSLPKAGQEKVRGLRKNICEALGLSELEGFYVVFREIKSGLEYIFKSEEVAKKGLYLRLGPYQSMVFTEIKELRDDRDGTLRIIANEAKGEGLKSIDGARRFIKEFIRLIDFDVRVLEEERDRFIREKKEAFFRSYIAFREIGEGKQYEDKEVEYLGKLESFTRLFFTLSKTPEEIPDFLKKVQSLVTEKDSAHLFYLLFLWGTVLSFLSLCEGSRIGRSLIFAVAKEKSPFSGFDSPHMENLMKRILWEMMKK